MCTDKSPKAFVLSAEIQKLPITWLSVDNFDDIVLSLYAYQYKPQHTPQHTWLFFGQIPCNRLILMNKWFAGCGNVKLFELHKNNICHEQFDFMDSPQTMIRCSRALYGDWVSINSTKTEFATEYLAFNEFRVFGRKYVWNIHLKIKCISSLLIAKVNYSTIKAQCIKMAITLTDTLVYES